jgi:hypothetical protein
MEMVEGFEAASTRCGGFLQLSPRPRSLEGFFVHMHIASLYLFDAEFRKAGNNYHYRKPNGRHVREDGDKKTWDPQEVMKERWAEKDPVRQILESRGCCATRSSTGSKGLFG